MSKSKKIAITSFIVLFLVLGGVSYAAYYFYNQYKLISTGQVKNEKEIENIKNEIAKHLVVPDEEPVIATVTDKSKLEQQAFFRQAENGDKVIIFQKAQKAILYRPSVGKIVDMTVLNSVTTDSADTNQPDNTSPITLTILNGTSTAGLAAKVEQELVPNFDAIAVTNKASSLNLDYPNTVVVDVSKKSTPKAVEIANFLGTTLQSLPEGEEIPSTDILIIAGADRL